MDRSCPVPCGHFLSGIASLPQGRRHLRGTASGTSAGAVVRLGGNSMSVEEHDSIDIVAVDEAGGTVVLSLVETRSWGERGELLPDLQAKLSTYLTYALDGRLLEDYPQVKDKRIQFRLHYAQPPGPREEQFLRLARERYLDPEGIEWRQDLLEE